VLIPLGAYPILRRFLKRSDAAAVAATFGSCSAVTFMTAIAFLDARGTPYSGAMTAVLALLEAPAIVVGIALARGLKGADPKRLLHESALNGAVVLLLGSMLIGMLIRGPSADGFAQFISEAKLPLLALFMLDMGLLAASKVSGLRKAGWRLVAFSLLAPGVLWFVGIGAAAVLAVLALVRWGEPGAMIMLAGGLIYVVGMFICTVVYNVPLNNELAQAGTGSAEVWARYLKDWTFWNHVRTLASTAAMALFIAAIAFRGAA